MPPDVAVYRRLTFQEIMSLVPLQDTVVDGKIIKRYMSQRKPWCPEEDVPIASEKTNPERDLMQNSGQPKVAFGGHVYSQAGMAVSRALADIQASQTTSRKVLGIHTIHGYFSEAGLIDRPFIYHVTAISTNTLFPNLFVTVRQPLSPSTNAIGDHYPLADAALPLGPVCFSAIVSFRPPGISQHIAQEPPVQIRFKDILSLRPPSEWDPAPHIDIAKKLDDFPMKNPGSFPVVDMKKVDLTSFNQGKPLCDRRELLLYRLLAPLPADQTDSHILAHAYEADRNGLLMIGNHVGFGYDFARAASLSYSFVIHVNPEDAVMSYGENEWWIQEACFPRIEAGRAIIMSKIWSPKGVHVATEYQDGVIRRNWKPGERQGKL
ncbi:Thioesterase/thiol ester dehydrase-isomerase [Annulohypoxylon maeteangense]|uniref:Thioesterase/thiol ester dehydrase-isomerase n=1 Tax=Annulohypoxylon maeteangense TaxID=1927788 RepID=UPI00200873C4|nr:Thioesterase/thiol ester dehydrase-isomerase [Annulohypoxylon maeteangense]KAI0889763.1 Thioesterase/thiol ester dehydrase-isomerase [Annulohypoxylon maeteangense]